MTTLRVRYRSGGEDEFQVREQHQPKDVAALLHQGLAGSSTIILGLASRRGPTVGSYAVGALPMGEGGMWELDPIPDDGRPLAAVLPRQATGAAGPPPRTTPSAP